MTQEQAEAQRDILNGSITGAPYHYVAIKNFRNYKPTWAIILIPVKYDVQYQGANFTQKQAFGRVSTPLIIKGLANFINNFNNAAAKDNVLGPYLGLKK